ncbi:DDE_3 domain-containing protein [Trichonephila clavipes]|nr:DDE_3 domain-containing protein [Trichonephila clavipes]
MWTYPAGSIRGTWNRPVSSPGVGNDSKMMAMKARLGRTYSWFQNRPACSECNDDRPHLSGCFILEQHVRLSRGAMGAEFLFMDDNARLHHANIVDECLQSEDITRMDWPA